MVDVPTAATAPFGSLTEPNLTKPSLDDVELKSPVPHVIVETNGV